MAVPLLWRLSRLGAWAASATGLTVLQADQASDLARRSLPYIGLSRLPGTWENARPRRTVRLDVPTAWALDFSGVTDANPAGIVAAGELVEVEGLAGEDARDAWLAAFAASYLGADGWLVAAAIGATDATLTTAAGWAPPTVTAGQQIALSASSTSDLEIWETPLASRWRLQVYGSPNPEGALAALRRSFERDPPPGLSRMSPPTVLSLPSGGGREIRGFVDLDLCLEDLWATPISGLAEVSYAPEPL